MSDFFAWFYPGDAAALGAAVVLLQITVAIALAAGAARGLARRGAAPRHAVWLAALGCVLVSPLLVVLTGRVGLVLVRFDLPQPAPVVVAEQDGPWVESLPAPASAPLPRERETAKRSAAPNPLITAAPVPTVARSADGTMEAKTVAVAPTNPWRAVIGALFLAWAVGSAFLLLRLLHGCRIFASLRRAAQLLDARRYAGVLDSVASLLRIKTLPPIRTSPLVHGPAAGGVLRPCVLLPERLRNSLDDRQLRDVLIHECAHLLRRDPLVGLLQRLAEAIFWPHPLVHYLNRRLARAREEVCDDYVLQAGDARAYARTLLTLAEGGVCRPVAASGLFDPNWKLEDRVAGLLDPRRPPMKRLRPWTVVGFTAVLLAACTAGAAIRAGAEPTKKDNADTKKPKEAVIAADVSKAVIEGVVVDEAGKPVADAVVRVLGYTPAPIPTPARTAVDGTFRLFLNQASARYTVIIASADEETRQGIYEFHDTALPQTVQARIVVKPSRKITAHVADAAKKPVEGAAVGVLEYSTLLAHAETDANGTVSLRLPSDARIYQVVALKPNVGFDYFENYRSWPADNIGDPPAQVDLTLNGARTLSVRAVDAGDKPLAGIELQPFTLKKKGKLYYANISGSGPLKYITAQTNRDGLAAFEWIPTDMETILTILYDGKEYCLTNRPSQNPMPPYETLTAKLVRKTSIGGKVTLPDGKPAAGVLLQVEGFRSRNVGRTKADGSYSLLVDPNQTYVIGVTDENWAARSYTEVVVGQEGPPVHFDFQLSRGTILSGKVTFGPDDKPAPKQTITLIERGSSAQLVRWAETDAAGRYAIRVGPGYYQIKGPLQRDPPEGITVKEEQTIDKNFHPARLSELRLLKGTVLAETADGKPVGGAILIAMAARFDGSGPYEGAADEKGRFEMGRPLVKSLLYARNPEGTLAAVVAVGEDDEKVKVVLSPAGKLVGRVLDKTGKPEKGASVLYGPRIGPPEQPFNTYISTQTDDAGRFTLIGVVPGADCTIKVFGKTNRKIKIVPAMKAETLDLGDLVPDAKK